MILRRTLNGRPPHSLADSCRNAFDWWEGPKEREFLLPNDHARPGWLAALVAQVVQLQRRKR